MFLHEVVALMYGMCIVCNEIKDLNEGFVIAVPWKRNSYGFADFVCFLCYNSRARGLKEVN
jgi:hypothetical protein